MSHPDASHDKNNEYPEDKVSHYPQKNKRAKSRGPLHNVANRLNAKSSALRKAIDEPASLSWFKKHGTPKLPKDTQ